MVVAYVLFPAMLGLSAVAHDLFAVLIGAKWMPTVPYFETICLAGLFYPVDIMQVRCSGPAIVRLEILKKAVMTVILVLTIPRSVQAVVWGLVVFAACEMIVNVCASLRVTSLSVRRFVRTLLPVALVSGAMYFVVLGVAQLMPGHALLRLVCMIAAGAVSYLLFSFIFRLEAFTEVLGIVRKQLFR